MCAECPGGAPIGRENFHASLQQYACAAMLCPTRVQHSSGLTSQCQVLTHAAWAHLLPSILGQSDIAADSTANQIPPLDIHEGCHASNFTAGAGGV